jgi:hypothetical protein
VVREPRQKCLESQIGKNVEAYIDDVVVKTTNEDDLIADLAQTFANLRDSPTSGTTVGSSTQRSASSASHLASF